MPMLKFHQYLSEGNPLARMKSLDAKGYHSVIISGERKSHSKAENAASMDKLKAHFREGGYGFKKTEGKWNEGEGVSSENSIHVTAKKPGVKGAAELIHHAKKISKALSQDAFIHRDAEGNGRAIFTHDTEDNKAGDKVSYGSTKYNTENPYGQTQYNPRKPNKLRSTFTFKE